jgi:hypothetical protein
LDKLLKDSKAKLEGLGPQRATTAEQASYLVKIASDFQTKTCMAIEATYYADDNFDNNEVLRLANNIVNRNENFAEDFNEYGHNYMFKTVLESGDLIEPISETYIHDEKFTRQNDEIVPVLEDIVDNPLELEYPADCGIATWLTSLYGQSRGFEIGTFDPKLLANAMKQQSTKWRDLCRGYVSDVVCLTHSYILELLKILCPDERVLSELLDLLMEDIIQGYKNALAQVDFILNVERSMKPATQNHYFNENLQNEYVTLVFTQIDTD